MDKNLKQALRLGFEAPATVKKEDFLRGLNSPKTNYRAFFLSQINYIRKRVWCFSVAVTAIVTALMFLSNQAQALSPTLMWIAAAFMPFLALLSVTELSRSTSFGMAELELSCRYNLPQIVMARAFILGISNLILLLIVSLAAGAGAEVRLLSACVYIFAPYLLTCAASVFAINHVRSGDSVYCCAVIACAVSLSDSVLRATRQLFFTAQYLDTWVALCLLSLLLLAVQAKEFIKTASTGKE